MEKTCKNADTKRKEQNNQRYRKKGCKQMEDMEGRIRNDRKYIKGVTEDYISQ